MICDLDSKVSHCEKSIKCVKLKRFVINYYSKCVNGPVLPDLRKNPNIYNYSTRIPLGFKTCVTLS
jgi:hypothetical protein